MDSLKNKDPLDILAWQFDIVCNGIELSSGAIRNHKTDIMVKAFEIAGYSEEDVLQDLDRCIILLNLEHHLMVVLHQV